MVAPCVLVWGCSADGVMGDKGACCCMPDVRAVLYSGTRAALHVRGVCDGRYMLLVPLAPLGAVAGAASCPAIGMVGGKGACHCLPNACTLLYGGTRAALHEFGGRGGRCVLLVPLAPLAHLALALLRLLASGRRRPYKLPPYCFWTSIMALGGDADQMCTIYDLVSVYLSRT